MGTGFPVLGGEVRELSASVIVVHSPQVRCGVREYGAALDKSLARLARFDSVTLADGAQIVASARPGVGFLVHFEPGVTPPRFADVIREAKSRGAKIVFCCHLWEPQAFPWDLPDVVVLHRHYPGAEGLVVPLGCPVYDWSEDRREAARAKRGWGPHDVVLCTVGLLATWKRLPDVADVMCRAIEQSGRGELRLHMQTPWPFGGAEGEERALRAAVARHPSVRASVSTEFLPEEELLDLAAAADVGFLYHGKDTSSVSAATKQFVSARTPLVVTRSSHSSDLAGGVLRVGTLDLGDFARECVRFALDDRSRAALALGMQAEYERINMDVVARMYASVMRELGIVLEEPKSPEQPKPEESPTEKEGEAEVP